MAAIRNKGIKLRVTKCTTLGDQRHGAPGGHPLSPHNLFSEELAVQLAPEVGLTLKEAREVVRALGRVTQRMLLRGQPVGIPHVGTLHLRRYRTHAAGPANLARYNNEAFGANEAPKVYHPESRNAVYLHVVRALRIMFSDNALYTGSFADHLKVQRERQSLRRRSHGHRRIEERIMSEAQPPVTEEAPAPQRKPRLLVEDADAVVTSVDGKPRVEKTPDRAAEAQRQGLDEHQV